MHRGKGRSCIIRGGDALGNRREEIGKFQLIIHLDGKGGGFAPVLDGDGLAICRIFGAKALTGHTGGGIVAFNGAGFIGALILHRENHAGQVEFGIALVVLRLCGSLGHRNAPHLFQRHGLGAVLGGRHFAGGGLIALLGRLGGVSIGVILQQLIGRSLGGRNLRLAVLEGERGILRGHGEGHGDPLCSILLQRNGNAVGSRHGVVLVCHGHAAGLLRVAGAGHGIGIRCIGGRQRHGGGAGISAAVDFERGIRGSNGKAYRRGGGLPFQRGVVPALDHEAIPQQGCKRGGFHFISGFVPRFFVSAYWSTPFKNVNDIFSRSFDRIRVFNRYSWGRISRDSN